MSQVKQKEAPILIKAVVNEKKETTIVCAQCGKGKVVDVSRFTNVTRPLRVKCSCGFAFYVVLERGKYYRKKTHLSGTYTRAQAADAPPEPICIENISMEGLGFRTKSRHTLKVDDVITVRFVLDTEGKPEISKTAVVRYINDCYVGVQFHDPDPADAELGVYLQSD